MITTKSSRQANQYRRGDKIAQCPSVDIHRCIDTSHLCDLLCKSQHIKHTMDITLTKHKIIEKYTTDTIFEVKCNKTNNTLYIHTGLLTNGRMIHGQEESSIK